MMRLNETDKQKTINLSEDASPHVFGYYYRTVAKYGKNSFMWFGPWPRLNVADPELIKEILSRPDAFQQPLPETGKILTGGIVKLKAMNNELQLLLKGIVDKRQKAMERGEAMPNDLLGALMESNSRFINEDNDGNQNVVGMSIDDVIDECKFFYFAGSKTTASLLVWAMVLLCQNPDWQTRAREEVDRVFGNEEPSFESLTHLKTVTMILQESLRLYPPAPLMTRGSTKTVKLGNMTIPSGVHMTLLIGILHRDPDFWGDDANEFNPHRFSKGVSNAANTQSATCPLVQVKESASVKTWS
ncbi:PREDICTED: cytochrome P450 CYP72A219-like [Erythranthe guttata]|uniref:cytochrome P450 CYP72A219-like n=1 Tax=Erythranthe guttata TaxID=4155 RepID=UPI00064DA0A0|nr:PREDICTED: cytochrome P450 CYP72A219-like [Erythranthe guttata]|eukprot:XP_012850547.1 PREDICTED: cytochrome P450 CYP72A219-like [Erythranthe guttata]